MLSGTEIVAVRSLDVGPTARTQLHAVPSPRVLPHHKSILPLLRDVLLACRVHLLNGSKNVIRGQNAHDNLHGAPLACVKLIWIHGLILEKTPSEPYKQGKLGTCNKAREPTKPTKPATN